MSRFFFGVLVLLGASEQSFAQSMPQRRPADSLRGCYRVHVLDSLPHPSLPPIIRLERDSVGRSPIRVPSDVTGSYSYDRAHWRVITDSLILVWTDGFTSAELYVRLVGDSLSGLVQLWGDAGPYETLPDGSIRRVPYATARAGLKRFQCP